MNHSNPDKPKTKQQVSNTTQNIRGSKLPKSDNNNIVSQNQTQQPYNFGQKKNYEYINLIIFGGILLVTAIYAVFAGLQWNIMRNSMVVDQRAWMGVNTIVGNLQVGKPTVITVAFKNTGKTPAKEVSLVGFCELVETNDSPNFGEEKELISKIKGVIMPQQEFRSDLNLFGTEHFNEAMLKQVVAMGRFYVHGTMRYNDIFRYHHWVTFCYYLDKDGKYKVHNEHNDTDDN